MTKGILFSTLALSFMALSFIGCSNDDVEGGKPLLKARNLNSVPRLKPTNHVLITTLQT